ncbi:MAG: chemotaxis protein CheW [Deltaproteobacteria bacterium]|nr:chemotaxis protein CheW [Deltaproteobacteria bacterium]
MARESEDLWQSLARSGESLASEEDYEHGYSREVRRDLRRCIAFRCGDELYGLSISELAEITKPFVTTPVPRTAEFVIGVGNIRGNVLPVIDLARRLRLPARAATASTRVLIVRHGDELHGIVVDEVRDVVSIPQKPSSRHRARCRARAPGSSPRWRDTAAEDPHPARPRGVAGARRLRALRGRHEAPMSTPPRLVRRASSSRARRPPPTSSWPASVSAATPTRSTSCASKRSSTPGPTTCGRCRTRPRWSRA